MHVTDEMNWDLGPFAAVLQCLRLDTPLLEQQNRNYLGLKITACMHSWGRFWTVDTKRPKNPTAVLKEPGAKAEGRKQKQRVGSKSRESGAKAEGREQKRGLAQAPACTAPPKRWANHLGNPCDPTLGYTLPLLPLKTKPTTPSRIRQAGESVVCSCSPSCCRGPSKALPEFLVWSVIFLFPQLRRPRPLVSNTDS